jgi:N-sulfoglucosamine sulfohydrolase
VARWFNLAFARRPAEELYDLVGDPFQLVNVAEEPRHAATRPPLRAELEGDLNAAKDPRVTGSGDQFDRYPYYTPPSTAKK